jgi:hypothetical protein
MRPLAVEPDAVARQAQPIENSLAILDRIAAPLRAASQDEPAGGIAPRWQAFVGVVCACVPLCKSGELNPFDAGRELRRLAEHHFVGRTDKNNPDVQRTGVELESSQQSIDAVLRAFWNATRIYAVVS